MRCSQYAHKVRADATSLVRPRPSAVFRQAESPASGQRGTRAQISTFAQSDNRAEASVGPSESKEKFLDVSELLRDAPEDFVFEEGEGFAQDSVWEHEQRFLRKPPEGKEMAAPEVKGALDPNQADILSAYSTEQGFKEMTVEALAARGSADSALRIIDVRTPEEYAGGHIQGSQNVSLDRLSDAIRAGELTDEPLAVICARGGRSAQACVRLSRVFGFGDVTNVKGGMTAWSAAGLPTQ